MSIKWLLVLSLVAVAASSPAPTFIKGRPILGGGGKVGVGLQIGSLDFGKGLKTLFGSIIGHKHLARNNLNDILNLKVSSFNDVCGLLPKVVVSLTDTIEASIRGLGSLLSRVIFSLLKITICFLGRAGGDNPICRSDINALVGVKVAEAADAQGLISLYGLTDCKVKLNSILALYTKGRGISSCRGSVLVIFRLAQELVERVQFIINRSTGKLSKSDFTFCFQGITKLLGVIGNSRQKGLGLQIVQNFVPVCNPFIVKAGFPDFGSLSIVQPDIEIGNNDRAPWAVPDFDAPNTGVTLGLGGIIGGLFKGLIGVTRLASNLIQDILRIVINSVEDVFNLGLKITLGLGGLLDATISGLGSLLVRIVAGLLKIILCFLGIGGKYGVCQPSWDRQVGINGDVTSIDLVLKLYGIGNCRAQVDQYIKTYTKGAGIDSTNGSVKILLQSTWTLAQIVEAKKWDKNTIVIVFRHITYLLGAVGNSNAKGVGTSVCNKFIPACNKYLTVAGFPGFGANQNDIITIVEKANDDDHSWSADIVTDNDDKTGFINVGGNTGGQPGGNTGGKPEGNNGDKPEGNNGGKPEGNTGGKPGGNTGVSVGDSGLIGGLIKGVFGTIAGVTKVAFGALDNILKIKIGALNDVFNFTVNLSIVLQATLNNIIFGLGSLFSRLIACIVKIGICVNGFPGDKGICAKGWNAKFGINGEASTAADLIVLFRLNKAQDELNGYITKITKGKGIKSTNGSIRITIEKITTLISFITNYKKFSKQTVTDTFIILTTISGSVSNSRKRGSGRDIIQNIIPVCGKFFLEQGYPDITVQITVVNKECDTSNGDNIDWNGGNNGKPTPGPGGDNEKPTPPPGGDNSTPAPGGDKDKPTPPPGGDNTTPAPGGDKDKPTPPPGGDNTTPAPGGDKDKPTPPPGSDNTTQAPGGDKDKPTLPPGGDNTTPAPGGDKDKPTPPPGGYNTTPAPGGDKDKPTPSPGGDNTTPAPGGDKDKPTPPPGGDNTTPAPGGDKDKPTPPPGGDNTTPAPGGDKDKPTPPPGGDNTTPAPGGDKDKPTPSPGGDNTTPAPGGDKDKLTPPPGGDNTTPAPGGDKDKPTPPPPGDNTTPAPGGDNDKPTPPPGGDNTTPASGGDQDKPTPPPGGDNTTPAPGGDQDKPTSPPGGDDTTPAPGGDKDKPTPPPGGDNTTPAPGGDQDKPTPPPGGDNNTPAPGGDNGNGNNCGQIIGGVIQVIPGVTSISSNIISEIINIKINAFVDIINLITKLTLALGGIIDSIVSGLGSLLIRIVAVVFKIGYCVNGFGSDKSICTKEWNAQWGVTGDATTAVDLIALFRLNNCKSDINTIISTFTNGKGVSSTTGIINIILQKVLDLSVVVSSGKITKENFSTVFINIISIFGSITNSFKQGSGTVVIQKVIPICGVFFVQQGFPDIRIQQKTIVNTIDLGNKAKFDWTIVKNGADSKSDKLVKNVKKVFKDVKANNNVNKPSVTAVLNLQAPRNFDDVCTFGVQVVQGLGGVVDLFINGLGTLIIRIVGGLINYIVAILGASRNGKSFVSQKAYYDSFGVKVSGSTWDAVATGFKINNCKADLDGILNGFTDNKGRSSLTGVKKVFFDSAYDLVDIVLKGKGIVEADLTVVFRVVTTLLGGFANSCSADIGKTICDNMLPTVSFYLEKNNYPSLGQQSNTIYSTIETCNGSDAPWASGTTTVINN